MKKDLLLVIDMQNVYGEGGAWSCFECEKRAENIHALLHSDLDIDVIFTQFIASKDPKGVWKSYNEENVYINQDLYANEIMDIFKEDIQKYPLYTKSTYSSLSIPQVKKAISNRNVVVTGVVGECCVLSTVMDLIDEGVNVIYLKDAIAGIDEKSEKAVETILSGLSPLHVQMMSVKDYIRISVL